MFGRASDFVGLNQGVQCRRLIGFAAEVTVDPVVKAFRCSTGNFPFSRCVCVDEDVCMSLSRCLCVDKNVYMEYAGSGKCCDVGYVFGLFLIFSVLLRWWSGRLKVTIDEMVTKL